MPQQKKGQIQVPSFPDAERPQVGAPAKPDMRSTVPAPDASRPEDFPSLDSLSIREQQRRTEEAHIGTTGGISEALKTANKVDFYPHCLTRATQEPFTYLHYHEKLHELSHSTAVTQIH